MSTRKQTAISYLRFAIATLLKLGKDMGVKLEELKTADGVVLFAEKFEVGEPVFILQEEAQVPLPVGEYILEDKRKLVVAEEGIIGSIVAPTPAGEGGGEGEGTEASTTPPPRAYTVDEIKALIDAGLSEQKHKYEATIRGLEAKLSEATKTPPLKPNPEGRQQEGSRQQLSTAKPPKTTFERVLINLQSNN